MPDTTSLSNEIEHSDAVGTDNPVSASLRDRYFLSDDPYGTLNPIRWLDRSFNVPDLAVGRLVESDADITGQIGEFLTNAGVLSPRSASGHGLRLPCRRLRAVGTSLTTAGLSTSDAHRPTGRVGQRGMDSAGRPDSARAEPGDRLAQRPLLAVPVCCRRRATPRRRRSARSRPGGSSSDLPAGILADSILFSAGCHGGMSVPDAYATANGTYPLLAGSTAAFRTDWAQALSSRNVGVGRQHRLRLRRGRATSPCPSG